MGKSGKIEAFKARVAADPYDQTGWEYLLGEISRGRKNEERTQQLREVYEDLLSKFPTAASYWREYCELEIDNGDTETVKIIFGRCLLTCLDIDLWRAYLRFIRKINDPRGAEGLGEIRQSYEFALDHIGVDVRSGPVWQDYINFLAAPKSGTPEHAVLYGSAPEGQEDSQKTALLRRIYHRALVVPNAALDNLWMGYERFENASGNKQFAKRLIDEWRPRFQSARKLVKERSSKVDSLDFRALPLPPGVGGSKKEQQEIAWWNYIHWERSNHQELDPVSYQTRVILAYEQALAILLLYADVWLDFADWHAHGGGLGAGAAKEVLHRGRRVLPSSLALHFAAAEAEEASGAIEDAKKVYEELVEYLANDGKKKEQEEQEQSGEERNRDEQQRPTSVLKFTPESGTLVWIQYMRFARRTSGMMAARKLFLRARKWPSLRWEAFTAAAEMEWATEAKDQIPRNIYELGIKSFISEPAYVLAYATFLQGLGDTTNARSLFERALTATPAEKCTPLYEAYIRLEATSGSLGAISGLEQRQREQTAHVEGAKFNAARMSALKFSYLGLSSGACTTAYSIEPYRLLENHQNVDDVKAATGGVSGGEPMPRHRPPQHGGQHRHGHGHGRDSRSRSRSPQPPPPGSHHHRRPPPPSGQTNYHQDPPLHIPHELSQLINLVRGPSDGPVPDIEKVVEVILRMDFSTAGITAHETAAARERRRQREARAPPGSAVLGNKRKAEIEQGFKDANVGGNEDTDSGGDSDSGGGDDDEEEGSAFDVYRRRMRARV